MNEERVILPSDAASCTGCGACVAVCPVHAVSMQTAGNGSVYPSIDDQACVRCGKCTKVCAIGRPVSSGRPLAAYAAAGRCESLVKDSASGGVFASLAVSFIRSGGAVAGAVMDCGEDVQVYHLLSDRLEDAARMQGSKYVHSDAWRCYADVQAALREGKRVLFSGTPCQTDAIRRLTGNPQNLTTIDLICHGVVPQAMFRDYIRLLTRRFMGRIVRFTFRDKSCAKQFCARLDVKWGRRTLPLYLRSYDLSYYQYFLDGSLYRENCYACPYAQLERQSDLTIGDYWGIKKAHEADFGSGAMPAVPDWSCVLVNSEKGRQLLDVHGGQLYLFASDAEWIAEYNQQLRRPASKPENRGELLARYADGGYAAVEAGFVKASGGKLRYHLRLLRNLLRNHRMHMANRGRQA